MNWESWDQRKSTLGQHTSKTVSGKGGEAAHGEGILECSGLCYSDMAFTENEFGATQVPFTPGHEVVGIVEAIGSDINSVKVGDRVGAGDKAFFRTSLSSNDVVGWMKSTCLQCDNCVVGKEQMCLKGMDQMIVGKGCEQLR